MSLWMKFNLQCNSSSNETSLVELQSIVLVRGVFIFSILEEETSYVFVSISSWTTLASKIGSRMSCAKTYFNKMENSLIRNFRFFAWHMAATFNDFLGETYIIDMYPILQCRKKNWQLPKYSLRSKRFCAV